MRRLLLPLLLKRLLRVRCMLLARLSMRERKLRRRSVEVRIGRTLLLLLLLGNEVHMNARLQRGGMRGGGERLRGV